MACSTRTIIRWYDQTEDKRKRALMLHCAGPSVDEIFDTLEDKRNDYKTATEKLTEYFTNKHSLRSIEFHTSQYKTNHTRQIARQLSYLIKTTLENMQLCRQR